MEKGILFRALCLSAIALLLRERATWNFNSQEWLRGLALSETVSPHPTEPSARPVPPSPTGEVQTRAPSLLAQHRRPRASSRRSGGELLRPNPMRAAGRTIIATLELEQDAARHVAQLTDKLDELQRGEVVDDGLLGHDQEAMTV